MSERRSRLDAGARAEAARAAGERLLALPELQEAGARGAVVAGFVATRGELDPTPVLDEVRRAGGRVALPRVTDGRPRLRFHVAAGASLRPGRFGILEPDSDCPEVASADFALMIAPGLAFDGAGHRLGFGGGYYDEVLGAGDGGLGGAGGATPPARPACVVAYAYDFQVVDACPATERDARIDCIVTDRRVIRCASGTPPADGAGRPS